MNIPCTKLQHIQQFLVVQTVQSRHSHFTRKVTWNQSVFPLFSLLLNTLEQLTILWGNPKVPSSNGLHSFPHGSNGFIHSLSGPMFACCMTVRFPCMHETNWEVTWKYFEYSRPQSTAIKGWWWGGGSNDPKRKFMVASSPKIVASVLGSKR